MARAYQSTNSPTWRPVGDELLHAGEDRVGPRLVRQHGHLGGKFGALPQVVRVEKGQVVALRRLHPPIPRRPDADVFLSDAAHRGAEPFGDGRAPVGRAIADDEDFE